MVDVFYARSSSHTQEGGLEGQTSRAKELGIADDHIFAELVSGKNAKRPKLTEMLKFVRKGDVLHVTKIDRLGRSTADLYDITTKLQEKGIELKVLDQPIDTTTAAGRAFFGMMAIFAEFERELIRERQAEGMARFHARLKAQGKRPGPDPKTDKATIQAKLAEGKRPSDIMKELGIAKTTYYRLMNTA